MRWTIFLMYGLFEYKNSNNIKIRETLIKTYVEDILKYLKDFLVNRVTLLLLRY